MARKFRPSKSHPSKSRPPKMGRKWTQDDILAYKIKVVHQDLRTFFAVTDLPPPNVEDDVLTSTDDTTAKHRSIISMLFLLDMKCTVNDDRESNAINLFRVLFEVVRYLDVMQRDVLCWLRLHHLVASQ